jgi:hypothetical protein
MPETAPRIIAECREYFELIDALRARFQELKVTSLSIEEVAGIPAGYFNKAIAAMPRKRLGIHTLLLLMQVMGLRLSVVVDETPQFEAIRGRMEPSKYPDRCHTGVVAFRLSKAHFKKIGQKGGRNSRKYLSGQAVQKLHSRIGKAGAAARWAARRQKPTA